MTLNRFNSFAPIRNGNSVKFLIDGKEYFEAVYQSISKAKASILITGWMLSP
jgi:phospholipase D1/2